MSVLDKDKENILINKQRLRMDKERLQTLEKVGIKQAKDILGDFQRFILRGNVVDLAVGIVIGAAFTSVVNALVADMITPLIGIFGTVDFSTWSFTVRSSVFHIGSFVNSVVSFLILATVVYCFVVRPVNLLTHLYKREVVDTHECPYCFSTVPIKASRCAYCTSEIALEPTEVV
jgi:large conductance mechanosensitive channel